MPIFMQRMFINQPSSSQPFYSLNGAKLIADCEVREDGKIKCWFVELKYCNESGHLKEALIDKKYLGYGWGKVRINKNEQLEEVDWL